MAKAIARVGAAQAANPVDAFSLLFYVQSILSSRTCAAGEGPVAQRVNNRRLVEWLVVALWGKRSCAPL